MESAKNLPWVEPELVPVVPGELGPCGVGEGVVHLEDQHVVVQHLEPDANSNTTVTQNVRQSY